MSNGNIGRRPQVRVASGCRDCRNSRPQDTDSRSTALRASRMSRLGYMQIWSQEDVAAASRKMDAVLESISGNETRVKSLLLLRAACKPHPFTVPARITDEDKEIHFPFLNPTAVADNLHAVTNSIIQLRLHFGLPDQGGAHLISDMLGVAKHDIAIANR